MILVLGWDYEEGTDDLLDILYEHKELDNLLHLSNGSGLSMATMNRRLKKLKEQGLLVSHKYKNNNMIWLIGKDAEENWSPYESIEIAKYRRYKSFGGNTDELDNCSAEERDNMLIDIPVFTSDKLDLIEDNSTVYFNKINKMLKSNRLNISEDLKNYVDSMWDKYRERDPGE